MSTCIRNLSRGLFGGVVSLVVLGCMLSSNSPRTGKEFIQKYSHAYQLGDVATLQQMTQARPDQSDGALRSSIENEYAHQGFEYAAWTRTRYLSEVDHGKYIAVQIRVDDAASKIILVRSGDNLKVRQYAEAFEP